MIPCYIVLIVLIVIYMSKTQACYLMSDELVSVREAGSIYII